MTTSDRRRQRRVKGTPVRVAALLFLLLGMLPAGVLAAQPTTAGEAQVVAQGAAEVPAGPVAWRVREPQAAPGDAAGPADLGFVVALDDPIAVKPEGGLPVSLRPGAARFSDGTGSERRTPLGDGPATYLEIDLVPAGETAGAAFGSPAA